MAQSKRQLLERQINALIAAEMRTSGVLVLQEVRVHPCEMDIIMLDPVSLRLATIEIKRNNWRAALSQAMRAKLFCHFAIAALPMSLRNAARRDEFLTRGVGLIFYEEINGDLRLSVDVAPVTSDVINRTFKQLVYRQFHATYGELLYA